MDLQYVDQVYERKIIMYQGWIKLHRKVQSHWIYQEKRKFSRYEAWLDLLFMANHTDNKFLFDGELKEVKRGELITSIRRLCDKWDWSNTKVVTFLKMLQDDEMITYNSDTKKTLVTVVNYRVYHDEEQAETTQKHIKNTSEAYQKHTNKNVKECIKNDKKNKRHKFETCDMTLAELFFSRITANNPKHKKPNLEKWANDIRLMRERDNRTEEEIEYLINWTQKHNFWHANILSPAKLREKFDTLVAQVKRDNNQGSNVIPITEARKDNYKYDLGF